MKTLRLSENDYQSLCMLLGYSMASHSLKDGPAPLPWKELVDWVLIQGNESNYTYYNDKNRLKEQKEAEIQKEIEKVCGGG